MMHIFLLFHARNSSALFDANLVPTTAAIAQLGERQTEDLKVPGSIPGLGIAFAPIFQTSSGSHPRFLARLFEFPLLDVHF